MIERQPLLGELLDATPDALVITDAAGRIVLANSQAEGLFGFQREELLGMSVEQLIPERFRAQHAQHRERFLAVPSRRPMGSGLELNACRKDGTEIPVEVSLSHLDTPRGRLTISAVRDISERRARERLEHEFIAAVAHELRNALTTIKGYAQLLDRRGSRAAPQAVATILHQAQQLERFINDLLDAAYLRAGGMELRCAEVDLAALVQRCMEQTQAQTETHQLRLEVAARPVGWWDADRLEQVWQNLLSNAVKYSSAGGRVLVRIEQAGQLARVSVTDEGTGIAPEVWGHLFDPFYRTETARASSAVGQGLGLFVSRLLVEAHGGQITVESAPGRGSTFRVVLPLRHG